MSATRFEKILVAETGEPPGSRFLDEVDEIIALAERRDLAGLDRALVATVPGFHVIPSLEDATAR
jgi:hypothetical protein